MAKQRIDKYVQITEAPSTGKTKVWYVLCRNEYIGEIHWYGGWRKYVFQTYDTAFYDEDFMYKIGLFCGMRTREQLSAARKRHEKK